VRFFGNIVIFATRRSLSDLHNTFFCANALVQPLSDVFAYNQPLNQSSPRSPTQQAVATDDNVSAQPDV
jgi:hypothetical protein